jgi:assimilatory nitrate reductase catalytic subunit
VICACFGVGRTTICETIARGARSVAELGVQLKAGTNCGSCIPELKRLIAETVTATNTPQARLAAAAN